ncbi:hypothetical protein GCM10008090_09480 [Arenicella chitinivorans]|uniref:Translesion DNA synthesis-associated protein ImuA n=1 Tax=Arenicella chitinivorans TaxID=1329800 RepID=A0A918RMH0_9GAMM|nr:translesion DNA synthesis-associated protein ImuA [Arenicella chitinivorans]GHA02285.1 hypothetical protein GCM10008090_09480 [Arenicella chitinivorans]
MPNHDSKSTDSKPSLNAIQRSGKLWRGTQKPQTRQSRTLDTGFTALNQQLHGQGWPTNSITELGLSQAGLGELRLLMPALRALQQRHPQQTIMWIAPPFLPFAPAFEKAKVNVSQLTILQLNNIQDILWSAEQSLLADCCAAVFCWTGNYNLNTRELRRLQLAAESTNTWHVLFRHSDCLKQSSAAGLRVRLQSDSFSRLKLHILKQPNGWGGQQCTLLLPPHYENWQRLPAHLLPQKNGIQAPRLPAQLETHHQSWQQASVTVLASLSALPNVQ